MELCIAPEASPEGIVEIQGLQLEAESAINSKIFHFYQ